MPQFFIRRPVFAWVIALFIILGGVLSIPQLPVAQYPSVAPPSIIISVSYPGASPEVMNTSVISLIEREISGVDNLLYFESSSDTTGMASITVTFKPGTDIKLAQMDLQNQIKTVEPRLPQAVRQNGLDLEAANSGFLMMVGLKATTPAFQEADLSDYFARNVSDELRRVSGVGKVQLFGAEKALRIWIDPQKLHGFGLSASDVLTAVSQQNMVVSPGRTGDEPATKGQTASYPVTVRGQLTSVEEFRNITLKSGITGARLKLADVARVESGLQSYAFSIRENGVPATAAAIQLAPGANAISTAAGIRARLAELSAVLPEGMEFTVPFDTAPFVKLSIVKVVQTFAEAMVLVFLVMLLFLHKIRCTLIPAIVAPVALLGTFTVMLLSGYSINILTMFGMVPNNGRVQQVIIQSDAPYRMQPEQLLSIPVKNRTGQMLPLSAFVDISWSVAPQQLNRYQGYPAIRITGSAAPGVSSGTAMQEMNALAETLPPGFKGEWAGSSLQEIESAAQLPGLMALSVLVVFMVLAALYESWSIPFAVMLVVPLGLIGAVIAVNVTGMTNDVFFKVGLITLIGLSAKNAILIIEFARQLRAQGKTLSEATITASKQRLRPILMTSLAFALGVVPLMLASGASDKTQHAIGTGVFGGMISGTVLAIFFVPVFFIVISRFTEVIAGKRKNKNDGYI
ncbi:TPA: hypothetical protein JLC35_004594 [Escherichia coli]|nr:hypothetical protein [Escherichia coli]